MWSKVMSYSQIKSKLFLKNSSASSDQLLLPMAKNPSMPRSPLNVDDEYNKTLRTKSFIDMWAKVHHELRRPVSPAAASFAPSPKNDDCRGSGSRNADVEEGKSTGRASRYNADRLPEFLLDPSQESLLATAEASDVGCCWWSSNRRVLSLLVEYFNTTFEACTACADLLVSIDRARAHYRSIRIVLIKLRDHEHCCDHEFNKLSCYIEQDNPLSPKNLRQFSEVQSCYGLLIDQLRSAHRRVLRRLRLIRVSKKAAGIMLVGACSAAVVLALLIAAHTIAGLGVIVAASVGAVPRTSGRKRQRRRRWASWAGGGEGGMKKLVARVDAAAKGAYIMGKDLETMSRMVRRAHDEVEHERDVARMVLRSRERQLVKEVAREVEGGAAAVAEQLQELEQHVHLCLITINRSRRLVAEEMAAAATGDAAASPVAVA